MSAFYSANWLDTWTNLRLPTWPNTASFRRNRLIRKWLFAVFTLTVVLGTGFTFADMFFTQALRSLNRIDDAYRESVVNWNSPVYWKVLRAEVPNA